MAHQVQQMNRDLALILQGGHYSTHTQAGKCLQMCYVCVPVFSALCVSDVTAPLPWAGMTPGCSEHIHIN